MSILGRQLGVHGDPVYEAVHTTAALAASASEQFTFDPSNGFNCYNCTLDTLRITKVSGSSTKYSIMIHADAARTREILAGIQEDGTDLYTGLGGEIVINHDTPTTRALYFTITNVTDTGSTEFKIELTGERKASTIG